MVASLTYLSCGFGPLPDAEVADDPGDEQTQSQVPVERAHVVNAWGNPQCSSPAETNTETMDHRHVWNKSFILKRGFGSEETHSQNSMMGEVAFGLLVWLIDVFVFWNTTQFSEGGGTRRQHVVTLKHNQSRKFWGAFATCVPCVVAGCPGQIPREREREVENPPGQDNDVVEVQQSHYNLSAITKTCRNDTSVTSLPPHRVFSCLWLLHIFKYTFK